MPAAARWMVVGACLAATLVTSRRLFRAALRDGDAARRALGQGRVYDAFLVDHGRLIVGACLGVTAVDGWLADGGRLPAGVRDVAVATFVLSCVGLVVVDARLGRAFRRAGSGLPALLTDGPYALVRHPRYLCWITGLLSVALVADSPAGGAATALLIAVVLRRIRREERFMRATYGAAYLEYMASTKRLVPWVF